VSENRVPEVGDIFIEGWAGDLPDTVAVCLFSWHPDFPKFEEHLGKPGSVTVELHGTRYDVRDLRRGEIGPNRTVIR